MNQRDIINHLISHVINCLRQNRKHRPPYGVHTGGETTRNIADVVSAVSHVLCELVRRILGAMVVPPLQSCDYFQSVRSNMVNYMFNDG